MNCTSHNVKVTEGNAFALILPLKSRHYVAEQPIDEDIDITLLQNVVVKVGGVVWEDVSLAVEGVTIGIPSTQARGTYNVELTAVYNDINIRAAYFECFTIVAWSYQSDVQNYIPDSPIIAESAFFVAGNWTDAELEALKEEYREKNAQLDQAIADAEEAKREWEQKAADLDGVAQESTLTQGVQDIREDISHIDIDTSTLAKQGTNPNATLTDTQSAAEDAKTAAQAITGYALQGTDATATNTAIKQAILDNAGVPTLTIPDSTAAQELAPNTLYIFASRTSTLTLTLGTPIVGIANEYHFFVETDATAPTINFPTGISWNGGSAPTIAANKTYEVSILNNIAAYFES